MKHETLGPQEMKRRVRESLCCPYCDRRMEKCLVPDSPFTEWPSEFQYICFNDECEYFRRGWEHSKAQHFPGSHRFMYDPTLHSCFPIPVLNRQALRETIVEDES